MYLITSIVRYLLVSKRFLSIVLKSVELTSRGFSFERYNTLLTFFIRISLIKLLLPLPDKPVITISLFFGNSIFTFFKSTLFTLFKKYLLSEGVSDEQIISLINYILIFVITMISMIIIANKFTKYLKKFTKITAMRED